MKFDAHDLVALGEIILFETIDAPEHKNIFTCTIILSYVVNNQDREGHTKQHFFKACEKGAIYLANSTFLS